MIICTSVIVSYALLTIEWGKAAKIIISKDISYAFTSIPAYRYYALNSYPHFCFCKKTCLIDLVSQIQDSRKSVDLMCFFVYFKFKGWKQLLFAEAPRQLFNFMFIYDCSILAMNIMKINGQKAQWWNIFSELYKAYGLTTAMTYLFLSITFTFWALKILILCIAFFMYLPCLFIIKGNLKEYCVHKIDKR